MTTADVACLRAAVRTKRKAQSAGKWLMKNYDWRGYNVTADGNLQERFAGKWVVYRRGERLSRPLTSQQVIDIAKAHGWDDEQ